MRIAVVILVTALLAAMATWFLPWWTMAVVIFFVAVFFSLRPRRAFAAGALSVILYWLVVILIRDIPNQHILSSRMAKLFSLPHYSLFITVSLIVGGLIGGLAGWSAGLMNTAFRKR